MLKGKIEQGKIDRIGSTHTKGIKMETSLEEVDRALEYQDRLDVQLGETTHGTPYIWQLSEKAALLIGGSEVFDE